MATCEVDALLRDFSCYGCLSQKQRRLARIQLLCTALSALDGEPCDPDELIASSIGYQALGWKLRNQIRLQILCLLTQAEHSDCLAQGLIDEQPCFTCLNRKQSAIVKLALLCQVFTDPPWGPPTPVLDPDAVIWSENVTNNGGTFSASTLQLVSDFITSCKANGLWTLIQRCNLYCGNDLPACLTPIKYDIGTPLIDTNSGVTMFQPADYLESDGLASTPDYGNPPKYLDTGVVPSSDLLADDYHVAAYVRTKETGNGIVLGAASGLGDTRLICDFFGGNESYFSAWDFAARVTGTEAVGIGFYQGVRTGGGIEFYQDSVSLGTSINSGARPTQPIFIHCMDDFGGPIAGTACTLAGYSIGLAMTAPQVAAYFAAWDTFQTALGRNV